MIAAQDTPRFLSSEEYFAWESQQLEKHEYIDGQVYAMSGGTVNHSRIAIRLTSLLDIHLEGTRCITGNSDLKVNIAETPDYTYPDASVTCDERDKDASKYITYPCLIVEVLSQSTEAYDRGGKFRLYRKNPVLQDYLLVSSTSLEVDLYHKDEAGRWIILHYQSGDTITLKSLGLSFPIEQIYRGLTFSADDAL